MAYQPQKAPAACYNDASHEAPDKVEWWVGGVEPDVTVNSPSDLPNTLAWSMNDIRKIFTTSDINPKRRP
jgi:hypothetical protein